MTEVTVCPECDSADIQHNHQHAYRCQDCKETFTEPQRRESHGNNNVLFGLAKKLDEADPDEVTR